ncbi:MAG: dihydropteroate synthase [Bacteroidales bacterium]|nr:dihydropteroate synthase [Bacteroidales bacterium]
MGIINVTPDSFYSGSRNSGVDEAVARAGRMLADGAAMLDVGGCSTRPGSDPVSEAEEMQRVVPAVAAIRAAYPDAVISVDTFRGSVARRAVEAGADIINDVTAGTVDPDILQAAVDLKAPYVLTHPAVSSLTADTPLDATTSTVLLDLQHTVRSLRQQGLCDIFIDPGFGFGKTLDQNYRLMADLDAFACFNCPVLVGISRKSMITRVLDVTAQADDALTGTTVVNTYALQRGAAILRVHDVRQAVDTVNIFSHLTR